jgi:hypothetical protein
MLTIHRMIIPNDLANAALEARDRLSGFARSAAAMNAVPGAAAAIFVDALTSAIHARLEELKSVAR